MQKVAKALFAVVLALGLSHEGAFGQVAAFEPQNPRIGDEVIVTYNPGAKGAAILKPKELTLQTLILPEFGILPIVLETSMVQSGTIWKGSFTLNQGDARFLLYQFISGDLKDDNAEQGWSGRVLATNGDNLEGTRYWNGIALAFGGYQGFKFRKDVGAAKSEIAQERKLFPNNYSAVNIAWYLEVNPTPSESALARITNELEIELKRFRNVQDALPMILVWMEQTGGKARADSLRQVLIAENPRGKVASVTRMREISQE